MGLTPYTPKPFNYKSNQKGRFTLLDHLLCVMSYSTISPIDRRWIMLKKLLVRIFSTRGRVNKRPNLKDDNKNPKMVSPMTLLSGNVVRAELNWQLRLWAIFLREHRKRREKWADFFFLAQFRRSVKRGFLSTLPTVLNERSCSRWISRRDVGEWLQEYPN